MLRAMLQFWDPSYRCFTFNQLDLTPSIEEYAKLLNKENSHIDDDKGLTMYALAIYGLVLFSRVRGQIDGQVIKLFEQDVIRRTRWLPLTHTIYRCGNKPWVLLTGPWGATSYAPALVRRQMGSLQFIPMTHDLSDMEFTYGCPNTVCKVKEIITD
ncbi:hypothetical protein PIB30_082559 [Stylosanthes scabra]|uniref:DUF7745 domain-containing protein n=1 Tax=Stylosanthes scabra TaxID=79078 RepID=A0ABU6YSC8_9FABA|nr:hypothetical protein [Stylosanthes scabra]